MILVSIKKLKIKFQINLEKNNLNANINLTVEPNTEFTGFSLLSSNGIKNSYAIYIFLASEVPNLQHYIQYVLSTDHLLQTLLKYKHIYQVFFNVVGLRSDYSSTTGTGTLLSFPIIIFLNLILTGNCIQYGGTIIVAVIYLLMASLLIFIFL